MEKSVSTETHRKYVIVKHADDNYWQTYWEEDPRITGVDLSHSAFYTPAGKTAALDLMYDTMEQAETECKTLRLYNPCGGYDVCPLIEL